MALTAPVALLVLALSLAGCSGKKFSETQSQQTASNILRYPIPTKPTTLDPGVVRDGDTIDLLQQVFEGLVAWGTDNKPQPMLAEKWDVEDGGKTYVFHLKHGIKFHNGREVTADDFKWTWERNCSPELASATIDSYLGDVVGVKEMKAGAAKSISGVTVVDPYTLKVQIDKPRPYFLGKLTYIVSAVMAKEALQGGKEISGVEQMIGTGPYKATKYVPDQLVTLTANADYHDGKPPIDGIERPVILDSVTRLNKFKAGEVDMCLIQRQDVDGLKADTKFASMLHYYARPSIFYIGMNSSGKDYAPFKNRDVRRAIGMAIDRERITKQVLGDVNEPAYTIIPPGVPGHRDKGEGLPYDVEGAKKLLASAGYPDGKGLPPLELRFRDGYRDISIVAEDVAAQLKENLGLDVSLKVTEWKAYLDRDTKGQNAFYHMRWAADYLDAQNFLSTLLASYGPENHHGYNNPEFDKLCSEADVSFDEDERAKIYAHAEDIVLQDAPWVPLYFQRDVELINPRVEGLRESLFGHLPHTTVSLKK